MSTKLRPDWLGLVLAIGLVVVGARYWGRVQDTRELQTAVSQAAVEEGRTTEVVVDLLVSASCAACQELASQSGSWLDELRERLEEETSEWPAARVVVRGFGLDHDMEASARFLGRFGRLDERSVGRRWLNTGAISMIWRDNVGSPEVPQLVISRRSINVDPPFVEVGPDEVLVRRIGVDEIVRWREAGFRINLGQAVDAIEH